MLIDWQRVGELRAEIGDDGFSDVVTMFLDESDSVIARIQSSGCASTQDLHFLRGAALNLGFAELAAQCHAPAETELLATLYRQSKSALLAEAG